MNHGICLRVRSIAILAVIVVFVLQTFALAVPLQVPQAQPTGPKIWLGERQQLPMQCRRRAGGIGWPCCGSVGWGAAFVAYNGRRG